MTTEREAKPTASAGWLRKRGLTNAVPKKLRVAEQTLHVLSRLAPLVRAVGRHDASLMRQLRRAAQSIYLNLNEGSGNRAGNQPITGSNQANEKP